MIFQPVCGCDGLTYSNQCVAESAGVDVMSDGECPPIVKEKQRLNYYEEYVKAVSSKESEEDGEERKKNALVCMFDPTTTNSENSGWQVSSRAAVLSGVGAELVPC